MGLRGVLERFSHALVRALVERALGTGVTGVTGDTLGGSNAVLFLELRGGPLRPPRLAVRTGDPRRAGGLGAVGRVGVPTLAVLVAATSLRHLDRPYLIMRWLPGAPAVRAPLVPGGRADGLAQLGQTLARLHGLALDGFGPLHGGAGACAGEAASWWGPIRAEGARRLGAAAARWAPDRAALVHGDFQLKNALVRGAHVTGILDFENLLAGDPLLDFAPRRYWSRDPARTMAALRRGYARSPLADPDAGRRLALYKLLLALEIRWWEERLGRPATRRGALVRLVQAVTTLDGLADTTADERLDKNQSRTHGDWGPRRTGPQV
jgi:aminoglycoside phosphotransferase (APT) family kinase protein